LGSAVEGHCFAHGAPRDAASSSSEVRVDILKRQGRRAAMKQRTGLRRRAASGLTFSAREDLFGPFARAGAARAPTARSEMWLKTALKKSWKGLSVIFMTNTLRPTFQLQVPPASSAYRPGIFKCCSRKRESLRFATGLRPTGSKWPKRCLMRPQRLSAKSPSRSDSTVLRYFPRPTGSILVEARATLEGRSPQGSRHNQLTYNNLYVGKLLACPL